ncbi:MAG: hypothetical protein KDA93_21780 [Planctomycetaceae bacterium]|nr:hypothetical protein [Planctomycetaceae bacterium]
MQKRVNPFTGESLEIPIDDGLTETELESLITVFVNNRVEGPEPDCEGYARYDDDGGDIRFRGGELDGSNPIIGFMVEIVVRTLEDDHLNLILDVCRAGNFALESPVAGDGVDFLLVDRGPSERERKRWPECRVITKTDELRLWLDEQIGFREVLDM